MQATRKSATISQRVIYLEGMFLSGKEEQALQEWYLDHHSYTDGQQDYNPEHLELGTKLHAMAGNVDQAREGMYELLHLFPDWNTSVMMTVFRAHTSSELDKHHDYAKDIYTRMKEGNSERLSIENYDAWFVGFLEARHLRYAKEVFRDMVMDGYLATSGTAEDIDEVLKRLHMLYRLGTDISKMTSIALDAVSVLPEAYHTHLFGDWMKSAVVHKAPGAAAQILDLMFQRNHKPETFHFNMLLKALLRTKQKPDILKAENIGWRMIDEARKAQKKELMPDPTAGIILQRFDRKRKSTTSDVRNVPKANVATCAMIMHHHAKRLQWEHVDYLSRQLKDMSIEPNATIMNVLMDNNCRRGAYSEAWMTYKTLTEPAEGSKGVFPNGATFRCLWKTLRLALGDHATRSDPNLPTPRELLKEMTTWWALSRSRYDAERFRQGLSGADHGAITSLILHCFSYTQDLAGSLVALHVLRHNFDIFPTDKAAQILQGQMAWVDMARESESVRSQYFHSRSNKKNSARIAKVYQLLLDRRLDRLHAAGIDHTLFSDEEIGDEGLNLLSEFVRVVLKRSYPPEVVEAMIDATRSELGLPDLPTGDMDAFEVA
ncbi:hypothetical protein BKA66DRAFT_406316 [Pyrenochaeta sp. MPI-SDFR-AT-0127]|nr:hypothetical protein BKA66DRAFT_406316 [Pyrenochaeta sp. MPI-SDFR-AT-0127]